MKYYKDDCHHYKVLDNHRVVTVTDIGKYEASISYYFIGGVVHSLIKDIKNKRVIPCTQKDFDTAFSKALNTINNLKKPKIMETNETKAVVKIQIGQLSENDLKQLELANIIPKGTPPPQVQIFATICKEKSLSPFQKQIYLLPFKQKNGDTWVTHYACIVGIDGYRTIAERTGKYAGSDDVKFNDDKTEFQCREAGLKNPITATVTIYKMSGGQRIPFTTTASWDSYVPANEKKRFNWNRMPYLMLGKCAEALALRKAFPEALSGLHAEEEAGGFENAYEVTTIISKEKPTKLTKLQSTELLAKSKILIDEYENAEDLQKNSRPFIQEQVKAGLNDKDRKELAAYISIKYDQFKAQ